MNWADFYSRISITADSMSDNMAKAS